MKPSHNKYFTIGIISGAVILALIIAAMTPHPVESFIPILFGEFIMASLIFIFKNVFLDTRWGLMEWLLTIILATVPFGWSLQHREFNKDTAIIGLVYAVLGFVLSTLSSTLGLMQADRHKVTASFPRVAYIISGWIVIVGILCAVFLVPFTIMKFTMGPNFDFSVVTLAGMWSMAGLALGVGLWWSRKTKSIENKK